MPLIRTTALATCCFLLLAWSGLNSFSRAAEQPAAKKEVKNTVTVVIDYGDGVQKHFQHIAWTEKMTVSDAMQAAVRHPRGIKIEQRGAGARALLLKIDDLANQGGGGRNWIFRVNGVLGDRSFGVAGLKPGDTVLWKFGKYR